MSCISKYTTQKWSVRSDWAVSCARWHYTRHRYSFGASTPSDQIHRLHPLLHLLSSFFLFFLLFFQSTTLTSSPRYLAGHVIFISSFEQDSFMSLTIHLLEQSIVYSHRRIIIGLTTEASWPCVNHMTGARRSDKKTSTQQGWLTERPLTLPHN